MKKRLTALLLLVCMLLTMMPVGAMAEDEDEEPDTYDAAACDHNWIPATCTAPKTCSKCSATEGEANGHTWQEATCTTPKTCSVCSATEGAASGHSWSAWTIDNTNHSHVCTVCKAVESGSHTYSASWAPSGSTHVKTCLDCGKTLSAEHNFGTGWVSNGDGTHSHVCADCGAKSTPVSCVLGTPATCKEPAKCKDCGGSIGEVSKLHEGTPTYTPNHDGTHTVTYSGCGHTVTEDCSGPVVPCKKSVCTKCNEEYGEEHHTKASKPRQVSGKAAHEDYCAVCKTSLGNETACTQTAKSNGNGTHDLVCSECDATLANGVKCAYDPATAVCSKKPVCKDCGTEYGDAALGHDIGANGCQRPSCDCTHPNLWTSNTPGTCKECKKTFQETALSVNFTVNGYGIGRKIADLSATPNAEAAAAVSNVKVTAFPDTGTFQKGTAYTITVTYTAVPGYAVNAATINGKTGTAGSGTVSVSMGNPEVVYTISYSNINGATFPSVLPTEYIASSLPITLPGSATKTGYTFDGWTGAGITTPTKAVTIKAGTTGNLVFTANFTANKYTVTYKAGAHGKDPTPNTVTVAYGSKCSAPNIYDNDYIIDYWMKPDGSAYNFSTPVTADLTLTAHWVAASHVTFSDSGYGTRQYADGTKIDLKKMKPARSGYYFCGWFSDKSLLRPATDPLVVGPDDVTIYAKWKRVDPTNPKTGDTQYPELAAGILAFSVVSLGAVTLVSKKKRFF